MTRPRPYVLVVDDVADAADSMAALLSHWGYDAEAWYCGATALAAARTRLPAAVLLDIGMAPMDGFTFAVFLRRLYWRESTPVVAVTGHVTEACRARARGLGINHYLLKPADPTLVRAMLDRLIGAPALPSVRADHRPRRGRVVAAG